jgi:hypothetical protein
MKAQYLLYFILAGFPLGVLLGGIQQNLKDWLALGLLMLIYVGGFFLILTVIKYITRGIIK